MTYRFFLCFLCFSLLPSLVVAQAQVRETTSVQASQSQESTAAANLIYDLQALQQEVLELRGQLEEQAHTIKRLKQQRLDDYLDLDKRIAELTRQKQASTQNTGSLASETGTGSSATGAGTTTNPQPFPQVTTPLPTQAIDHGEELYNSAIDTLLNQQDYTGAQKQFSEYIERYPQGKYLPNVYYWQGQILFAGGKKKDAQNSFQKLIEQYPSHSKTADAKFKLAKIYFEQGKKDQAKVILTDVAASDTDVAVLAKSFLSKNY